MPSEQIRVIPKPYRGRDPRKQQQYISDIEVARQLEEYLNSRIIPGKPHSLDYFTIAQDLNLDRETVHRLLYRVRGGDNGITI